MQGTLRWKKYPRTRKPRDRSIEGLAAHTCTIVGDKVYVLGGYGRAVRPLHTFSLSSREWKSLPGIKYRYSHCCVLAYDKLYVFGGGRKGINQRTAETYDLLLNASQVVITSLPITQMKCIFVESREIIVLLGKRLGSSLVLMFNINSHELTEPAKTTGNPPLVNGSSASAVEVGKKLVVLSEAQDLLQLSTLTIRDKSSINWETVKLPGPSIRGRHRAALHLLSSGVIVYGGRLGAIEATNRVVICDTQFREIVEVGPGTNGRFVSEGRWPYPGESKGSVVCGDKLIVLTWTTKNDMAELEVSTDSW